MDEKLITLATEDSDDEQESVILTDEISVESEEPNVQTQETVEMVEVQAPEEVVIEMDESIGWVGGDNTRHYSLAGRDEYDQHPITAITGLRHELDKIEALQPVYSNEVGSANYYKWNSGTHYDAGYFVGMVPGTSTITICNGSDILGVTVESAGFIGGQDGVTLGYVNGVESSYGAMRDNSYGLVATSGFVDVRCESSVVEGDYVVSNAYGIATKTDSDCGYKVIAIENKNGVDYAAISLGVQACTTDAMGQKIRRLDERMDDADINITAAMNVANEAYNKSNESGTVSEEAVLKALEALAKAEDALGATNQMGATLVSVNHNIAQAKAIAEGAVASANSIRQEAYEVANDALSNVNDLIEDLEPIAEWGANGEYITIDTWDETNKDTTQTYYARDTKLYYYYYDGAWVSVDELSRGAEYLTTYIKDGLATKAEVQTVEKATEYNNAAILKNAESLQTLVSSVDKYSVGEYSQAYGLTLEQARNILKEGMIYIPTVEHTEDSFADGNSEFLRYAYYEWDGEKWVETTNAVSFASYVPAGDSVKYWYIDSDSAPAGYEAHALYILINNEWTKVNTLAGNVNNRITSMIRQEVDEITAEVVNMQGDIASSKLWIDNNSANVQDVVAWKDDNEDAIATTIQSASDSEAYISQVASVKNSDGTVNAAASIVAAVNGADSSVVIEAAHLELNGYVTVSGLAGGTTEIDGACLKTGTVTADKILVTSSSSGKTIFSASAADHTVNIAGWTVDSNSFYSGSSFSSADCFICTGSSASMSIADSPILSGWMIKAGEHFGVTNTGDVYANNVYLTGQINATSGYIGDEGSGFIMGSNGITHSQQVGNNSIHCTDIRASYISNSFIQTINAVDFDVPEGATADELLELAAGASSDNELSMIQTTELRDGRLNVIFDSNVPLNRTVEFLNIKINNIEYFLTMEDDGTVHWQQRD